MRVAWIGLHAEGMPAFEALLATGADVRGVFTLPPDSVARRSGSADYGPLCERHRIPLYYVSDINGPAAHTALRAVAADIAFVIGWPQYVRGETIRLARLGMIGAHASLLPHNRGSAPVNWAIIRGETESGNTLLWLDDEPDAGEIIDQVAYPITPYDTCATLFQRAGNTTREMLLRLMPRLNAGERPGHPQPPTREPVLRRRRHADGRVDWSWSSHAVYDFIRALTRPSPGAFSWLDDRCCRIWHAALPAITVDVSRPGEVIGPVVSPVADACGQLVACGNGAIVLLEVEEFGGRVLRGRALSEQPWAGKRWHHDAGRTPAPVPASRR